MKCPKNCSHKFKVKKPEQKIVTMQYTFELMAEHPDHFISMIKQLKSRPIEDLSGTGKASDDEFYSFSCKRIGDGELIA